jgi:hypothetical protein
VGGKDIKEAVFFVARIDPEEDNENKMIWKIQVGPSPRGRNVVDKDMAARTSIQELSHHHEFILPDPGGSTASTPIRPVLFQRPINRPNENSRDNTDGGISGEMNDSVAAKKTHILGDLIWDVTEVSDSDLDVYMNDAEFSLLK